MTSRREPALRRRIRRLKTLPVLPTLLTAGNLASGITAILCAANADKGPQYLYYGAILVFVAMICDMLDGKVARMTGTDGAFGAELDSLSDVVSFGVAPAILMHRLIIGKPGVFDHGERLLWFLTIFFPVMAAIRLARYNVEHSEEPAPWFRGLPSPGAAAVICAWIIFHHRSGFFTNQPLTSYRGLEDLDWFRWMLLAIGVLCALSMVSTLRFPHIGNTLLGRLSFRRLIVLMAGVSLLVWWPELFLVVVTSGYLLLGLGLGLFDGWRQWRRGHSPLADLDEDDAEDAGLDRERQDPPSGPAPGR